MFTADTDKRLFAERCRKLSHSMVRFSLSGYSIEQLYFTYARGDHDWSEAPHSHAFYEVCYIVGGQGRYVLEGAEHPICPGQMLLTQPQQVHTMRSREGEPLEVICAAYTLSEHGGSARAPHDPLLGALGLVKHFIARTPDPILPTTELLLDEVERRQAGYEQAVEMLAGKLMLDTVRGFVGADGVEPPMAAAWTGSAAAVHRMEVFLRRNYARPIRLRDVAGEVHLSERHATRLFRSVTGQSIVTYLTELRMAMAQQLLLRREMPIKQIAWLCGYPSVFNFSKAFRRHSGQSPSRFRDGGFTRQR